jgi:hypothetical protein
MVGTPPPAHSRGRPALPALHRNRIRESDMGPADIDSIPKPPYKGQGKRLPSRLGINGDWIIEGRLLLARMPPHKRRALIFTVQLGGGRYCEGIDADLLAREFEIMPDAETLLEMNRDRCLAVSMQDVASLPGTNRGIFFTIVTPWGGCYFRASAAPVN